jgi:hypothetical protein
MRGPSKARPKKARSGRPWQPHNPAMAAVFSGHPKLVKSKLLALRRLILDTARASEGVGPIDETLKWGQASFLTSESKTGSTIRIDRVKGADAPGCSLLPLSNRLGRNLSHALPGTPLLRQSRDLARRKSEAAQGRAPPLRGAGTDVSPGEAENAVTSCEERRRQDRARRRQATSTSCGLSSASSESTALARRATARRFRRSGARG